MAEQSTALPRFETDGDHSKRKSLGNTNASEGKEKVLPHYLRASTGSCHDFCKYGRKHAFEEKARRPSLRRITVKPPDTQDLEEFQQAKRTSGLMPKPSSNRGSIAPKIIKTEVLRKSVDGLSPVLSKGLVKKKTLAGQSLTKSLDSQSPASREVLAKKVSAGSLSRKSFDRQSLTSRDLLNKKKMHIQEAPMEASDSHSSISSEIVFQKKKASLQGRENKSVDNLRSSPHPNAHLPKFIKRDMSFPSKKPVVLSNQTSSKANGMNTSVKHGSSLKVVKLSCPDASRVFGGRRHSDVNIGQKTGGTKIALKKVQSSPRALLSPKITVNGVARGLASPRASFSGKPSLLRVASIKAKKNRGSNFLSPLKNQRKVKEAHAEKIKVENPVLDHPLNELEESNNDLVQEKTLYVIKMEVDNKQLESDDIETLSIDESPSSSSPKSSSHPQSPSLSSQNEEAEEESEYILSESEDGALSEYDEAHYIKEARNLGLELKGKLGKAGMVPSVDKDGQPVKLRFRRGRIVEIQSENGGPRRLKFRRGRVLGDNQSYKADARQSFKSIGVDDDGHGTKPDSEKVVLRHQDAQGKKDAQGLFNNVIEETASKLVETRKSKVKALVGAFETVISLQDRRPSANSVS